MKYLVEKFYFDSGSMTLNLPDEYEPIGFDGNYVIAKKLVGHSSGKVQEWGETQGWPPVERKTLSEPSTPEDWEEHAKQLATHWNSDEYTLLNERLKQKEADEWKSRFHPDDLDYKKGDSLLGLLEEAVHVAEPPEEEPLTINPVDKILLENIAKEYAWEDEQRIANDQGGVFRHCEECNNIETIYPIKDTFGMFTSKLDFCTRCEKPWGMGMEKDAWAEGQMMPGMREGIKIEAPDPIPYMCILCSYKSETFARTGAECEVDEDGMHDWMLEAEYWDMVTEHQEHNTVETVYKPCIFCGKPSEFHDMNTHGYEPRERCKWCPLDEHQHHEYMHEYDVLTEPGPNRGHCGCCGNFNDKHSSWCQVIPKSIKAQSVCPVGFHDDISMHLCQCSAGDIPESQLLNTNTGYPANTTPGARQQTDDQMEGKYIVDGGRTANSKAYAEQYGASDIMVKAVNEGDRRLKEKAIAKQLATEAQRGDQPKVRCSSCQMDDMECGCA